MAKINSRAKGKTAEREVIGELKRVLPELTDALERNLEQTRGGGYDIVGLEGWAPEVKRYAEVKPADTEGFWEQAIIQARKECLRPALFVREDRRPWTVRVRLSDISNDWDPTDELNSTAVISMESFAKVVRRCNVS